MALPQTGIFALGNASHAYLEFDLAPGAGAQELVRRAAALTEPRTTMGGVNVVTGFAPGLWSTMAPDHSPGGLRGFTEPVIGRDGFTMPATQHDLALWIAGASYDVVFDSTITLIAALDDAAVLAEETVGWTYHRDLDLTGFVDGTENPPVARAPFEALVPDGEPGAGGSVLLLQRWAHDSAAWTALPTAEQEQAMGRTKATSEELSDRPETSHVARTDQDDFGTILRRNTPYGTVRAHGTMFVGFSATQAPLATMLASMAGVDGERDALTRYTTPQTGAYYFVPSLDDLARLAPPAPD